MGTTVRVELWSEHRSRAETAVTAVLDEMRRIDRALSPLHAGSLLSRINREAVQQPVPLSDEMYELFSDLRHMAERADGTFDIVRLRPAQSAQGANGHTRAMDMSTANGCRSDWHHLWLDPHARSLRLTHPLAAIAYGHWVHGYAVDCCATQLREHGMTRARIRAGQSQRLVGRPPDLCIRSAAWQGSDTWRPSASATLGESFTESSQAEGTFSLTANLQGWSSVDTQADSVRVSQATVYTDDALSSAVLACALLTLDLRRALVLLSHWPGAGAVLLDQRGRWHSAVGRGHAVSAPSMKHLLPARAA